MKNFVAYGLSFIILFGIGFYLSDSDESDTIIKRTRLLMGTLVEIQIKGLDEYSADGFIEKAFDEMKRIDNMFSTHSSESAIRKINDGNDLLYVPHPEIFFVMNYCDSLYKISKGSFDISLGTLLNTWNFESANPVIPTKSDLERAITFSGWNNIEIRPNGSIKKKKDVRLNFGAIAKGYAVDKAVELLERNGVKEALVNAGGEIRELGNDWVVGIQHPRNKNSLLGTLKLSGMSVATSGDYEQYFEKDGVRYHHLLDPKKGYPATKCRSVTVISKSDMEADGLATAVFIMGPEEGIKLIEELSNNEAMIVDADGRIHKSSGFNKYLLR